MSKEKDHNEKNPLPDGGKFTVPEGYFGTLEGRLKEGISAPDLPEGGTFSVPGGYFMDLEKKVLRQSTEQRNKGNFFALWVPVIAAAASLAIFLVVYIEGRINCESFACLLERSELTPEDLLFIEEEVIADYYLEYGSLTDISPGLEDEIMESLLEDDFDEEILEVIPLD